MPRSPCITACGGQPQQLRDASRQVRAALRLDENFPYGYIAVAARLPARSACAASPIPGNRPLAALARCGPEIFSGPRAA
jgi:hypothetical protein